jgi:hypothetical protein
MRLGFSPAIPFSQSGKRTLLENAAIIGDGFDAAFTPPPETRQSGVLANVGRMA